MTKTRFVGSKPRRIRSVKKWRQMRAPEGKLFQIVKRVHHKTDVVELWVVDEADVECGTSGKYVIYTIRAHAPIMVRTHAELSAIGIETVR